jgi:hypothetical protein
VHVYLYWQYIARLLRNEFLTRVFLRRQVMLESINRYALTFMSCVVLSSMLTESVHARTQAPNDQDRRHVDVVIALDVSGSMSGLIASAKQRLWDVVNELGRAQPQPVLRLAILSYGNPSYGVDTGYVKIDLPFTTDLDAVNETLFGFGTSGGDEYVARVAHTAINELDWSENADALKILFIAGNEAADQDPQISVGRAAQAAVESGIIINAIYCGEDTDDVATGWRSVATLTQGLYASIDQNSASMANIVSPMDEELAQLNAELNDTYLAYGQDADQYKDNQREQDANAYAMSPSAAASRTVTKAGNMYDNSAWDVVDAVKSGTALEEFETEDLPDEMQSMNKKEREEFVRQYAEKRDALQGRVSELDEDRRVYIASERAKQAPDGAQGLDEVMQESLRTIAGEKGFTFED